MTPLASIPRPRPCGKQGPSPPSGPAGAARLMLYGCLLLCHLWTPPICQGGSPSKAEHDQEKAAYLHHFLQFVTWPNVHRPAGHGTTMVIGLVGDSPVQRKLEALAAALSRKEGIRPRIVTFGRYADGMDLSACHILFIGAAEQQNFGRIIAGLKQAPVLTVADSDGFLTAGGMITMLPHQGRIRYHINRKAASRAGLRLSAQLLQAAIDVQDTTHTTERRK